MFSLYKYKDEKKLIIEVEKLSELFPALRDVLSRNQKKMLNTFLNDRNQIVVDFGFFTVFYIIEKKDGKITNEEYKQFSYELDEYCFRKKHVDSWENL